MPGSDSIKNILIKLICLAKNQIELIFDFIGTPTEAEIANIPREKSRQLVKSLKVRKGKNYEAFFPKASPNGKK